MLLLSTLLMTMLASCPCTTELESSGNEVMSVEEALDQKRIIEIYRDPKFVGSGGPSIPLPNGTTVTRDIINEAIEPLIKEGRSMCPALVKALKSEETHVRYGAYLALRSITKSEIVYYPFFSPSDPKNLKAYEQWDNLVKTLGEHRFKRES